MARTACDRLPSTGRRWVGFLLILAVLLLSSGNASANTLDIFEGRIDKTNKEAIDVTLFFTVRDDATARPVKGVTDDDVSVLFKGSSADLQSKELTPFKESDVPIAAVFVFPITNNYDESLWQIRGNVASKIEAFMRPVDYIGAIGYDSKPKHQIKPAPRGTVAGIKGLAKQIENWEQTEEPAPNLYAALSTGLRMLDEVEDAKLKYLIIISDAEGAITDTPQAAKTIQKFRDQARETAITPIVVAYYFDEEDGRFFNKLEEMGAAPGAVFYKADRPSALQSVLDEVLDELYMHYILEATLAPEQGGEWVETGKYEFALEVDKEGEATGEISLGVHELEKSYMWILWLILGLLGGLLLIFIIIKVIRGRGKEEEEVYVEGPQEPQSYQCQTCGRTIPEELYGFQGEFCIEGGRPDCPYYQMPDRGRLVLSRGPLAGVTFFIKEEVTTIGRQEGSHVMLKDGSVSRRHAAIRVDEGMRYELRDFDSASGTFCNGEKVSRKFLRDGDKLSFGTVEVEFRLK